MNITAIVVFVGHQTKRLKTCAKLFCVQSVNVQILNLLKTRLSRNLIRDGADLSDALIKGLITQFGNLQAAQPLAFMSPRWAAALAHRRRPH
jgi:hypothetical protein